MQKNHQFSFSDLHQELDVPDVLRICAEHILRFIGISAKALFFLPDQAKDWSLSATAGKNLQSDLMTVGDILANRFIPVLNQDVAEIRSFASSEEMSKHYGVDCSVLDDEGEIVVVSGESGSGGEVLIAAIIYQKNLLSSRPNLQEGIAEIMNAVAKQLGRCVKVHFRHLPETDWGSSQDSDFINS
jgi:hypothetical protein